jgi:hypothetical protein
MKQADRIARRFGLVCVVMMMIALVEGVQEHHGKVIVPLIVATAAAAAVGWFMAKDAFKACMWTFNCVVWTFTFYIRVMNQ